MLFIVLASLAATACITIVEEAPIEVTPGVVPEEIRDASWPRTPVTYCIVRDEEGGFADHETFASLTQRAVAAWGIPSAYTGDCDGPITAGNGVNEIGWGDLGSGVQNLSEAGNTSIRYRSTPSGGPPDIIEADITIAREPARGRDNDECLYTTLLHEVGHLFGVPHLEAGTVMSPVISDCLQELTPGDIEAIQRLY